MLRCLRERNIRNWDVYLPQIAGAIRSTVNRSTGFTPNKLIMLGREVFKPVDAVFGVGRSNQNPKTRKPPKTKRFYCFLGALRRGVAPVGSGWCASLRSGPRVFVGGNWGLLLRARGRGWVACSLPFSLPPFLLGFFVCCWYFWLFLSSSVLASRLACSSLRLPPRCARGDALALLAFRFRASLLPWLHLTLMIKV